ncbi:MAG: 16S rRNA (cytidine(1402)-2'-O)-methyltransferase [Bacteroidota bacterium]|nr:16S rRNA (cytidine(1402)-2'-O)-methyltransferase [Bacteroidota bacterium]
MLYIIPTPIGNLKDITLRCIEKLKNTELIIVENYNKSKILFKEYNISAPYIINNTFNESSKLDYIISKIKSVSDCCLITDSGTPGISDPGFLIIRKCVELEIDVKCLPGPTALIPALIQSGFPCEKFVFEGFLPKKKGKLKRLDYLLNETRSVIIYESPHRILKTLEIINNLTPNKKIVVIKELTKIHENIYRGISKEIIKNLEISKLRGEFIIIINGSDEK